MKSAFYAVDVPDAPKFPSPSLCEYGLFTQCPQPADFIVPAVEVDGRPGLVCLRHIGQIGAVSDRSERSIVRFEVTPAGRSALLDYERQWSGTVCGCGRVNCSFCVQHPDATGAP